MKEDCPKRPTILGVDVSKWQGKIFWDRVAKTDVEFAIMRAAYGIRKDKWFDINWHECSKTPLVQGCYQYLIEAYSGEQQANALCDIIEAAGGLLDDDLPPVLDVEQPSQGQTRVQRALAVADWIRVIEERLDRTPIIYTTPYYWRDNVQLYPAQAMKEPLWISHVDIECPLVPESWPTWFMWQYSWTGHIDGIFPEVDLNKYEGSVEHLRNMCTFLTPKDYDLLTKHWP